MKEKRKKTKTKKQTNKQREKRTRRGTEVIVKGCELNDFVVHLS